MSPGSRSASAMSRMTRARPSTVPAETGKPTSAPAHNGCRRYAPATPAPSDGDALGIGREHPGWRERFIRPERAPAPTEEPPTQLVRRKDGKKVLERREEDD